MKIEIKGRLADPSSNNFKVLSSAFFLLGCLFVLLFFGTFLVKPFTIKVPTTGIVFNLGAITSFVAAKAFHKASEDDAKLINKIRHYK